jgi:hypothetical protein
MAVMQGLQTVQQGAHPVMAPHWHLVGGCQGVEGHQGEEEQAAGASVSRTAMLLWCCMHVARCDEWHCYT